MNWNQALFPSLQRRSGCAIKKMSRSNLSSRRRGGQIGEIFRPEEFRRTDHPVCGASEASRLFINAAASPPFQGGECVRTETVCQFIHTFFSPRLLTREVFHVDVILVADELEQFRIRQQMHFFGYPPGLG